MDGLKPCPFCGGRVELMNLVTPIKMFYCLNYDECGAVVSFNNPRCDRERGNLEKVRAWNRRDYGGAQDVRKGYH